MFKTTLLSLLSVSLFAQAPAGTFTLVGLPDAQYQASPTYCPTQGSFTAGDGYKAIAQWITNDTSWNIKAVQSYGDVVDSGAFSGGSSCTIGTQDTLATTAYNILFTAHKAVNQSLGNHDYTSIASTRQPSCAWVNGIFKPSTAASTYNSSSLGGGDTATWGGQYTTTDGANTYHFLNIGGVKYGIMSLEFYPGSAVLNWAYGVMIANPAPVNWILITHAWINSEGTLACWPYTGQPTRCDRDGPATTFTVVPNNGPPYANSPMEMWYGSSSPDAPNADATWTGAFRDIPNLIAIFNGHFLGMSDSGSTWKYAQHVPITASDGHVVQQVFANAQGVDFQSNCGQCLSGTCPAVGASNGNPNVGNLLLLNINPATHKASCYMKSTNTGNYLQSGGRTWGSTQYDICGAMDLAIIDPPVVSIPFTGRTAVRGKAK